MKNFVRVLIVMLVLALIAFFLKKKYSVNPPMKDMIETDTLAMNLKKLTLPAGFKIEVFADNIKDARSMCLSPNNTLFVGNRDGDKVYALRDEDGDNKAEKKYIVYSGGNMPNGVAFKDGSLYIAEVNRILRIDSIESKLDHPGTPKVVYDKFPTEKHHGWKYIAFGPDGKLYVPVGAPCNICESKDPIYASITRMNADGTGLEVVQHGVRNTVGFTWHPDNNQLWFTDNGRDMLGDEIPNCELNHAPKDNMHFGYPYCHQGDILDPEFGKNKKCTDYTAPVEKMGPHVAPLGIQYYRNASFPATHNNKFFIAKHGSWNRTIKNGYVVDMVDATPDGKLISGRPVDLEIYKDGSLLISDDFANCIYRVSYAK
jgi:glucose/arabinose dehydrogenase